MSRVCVFCASSRGTDPRHAEATVALGRALVERSWGLVYGGGSVGLMGLLADTVLEGGGEVIGVIPTPVFSREVGHRGCTELIEVGSMHERKVLMYDKADAFVALPGGFGTLEELAEILTWSQIGLHAKPVGVVDVGGYWRPLLEWCDTAVRAGLLKEANRRLLVARPDPVELLDALAVHRPPRAEKWIDLDET
ncbi:MAG: TIGR00730 family Rossman fold protein [Actinomyces sp.]|nr:MAG: TIGR00730 family Rossman fold protein [Actinomyces sp.]